MMNLTGREQQATPVNTTVHGVVLTMDEYEITSTLLGVPRFEFVQMIKKARREEELHTAQLANLSVGRPTGDGEDSLLSKTPSPAVQAASEVILGMPSGYITKIAAGEFRPMDLPRLRANHDLGDEDTGLTVDSAGRLVPSRKGSDNFKNFGSSIDIWTTGITNYAAIMVMVHPDLEKAWIPTFLMWIEDIRRLGKIYPWSTQALPYAVKYHSHVCENGTVKAPSVWKNIPAEWKDLYLRIAKPLRQTDSPRSRPVGRIPHGVCIKFQSDECDEGDNCKYKHTKNQ
jgi:hypothetical protein